MERVKDIMEKDDIEFEAFKCSDCGEEIMDMKQLHVLANKYRKLSKSKEVVFAKWGNSLAVRIPNDVVQEYGLKSGKHGVMTTDKRGIKIIPD